MNNSLSFAKPLVFVCSAVIILSTVILTCPSYFLTVLMLAVISAGIMFWLFFVKDSKGAALALSLILVLGAVCPYVSYISNEKYAQNVLGILGNDEYTFSGEVVHASSSSRPVNARIKVLQINERQVRKPFYVQVTSFSGDLPQTGDSIDFKGVASAIGSSDNSEFDTLTYLRSKSTFIEVYGAEFMSNRPGNKTSILSSLRAKYEKAVYTYVKDGYNYKAPGIVKALTLADKHDFTKSMTEDFAKSGLSHLMCVSGLHLSVLLGMIASFLKATTLHKNIRCVLLVGFCVFYIFFTGASPSVIRAGLMASLTYAASVIGRKNDSLIALFVSGATMTLINPYVVLDISARLSFVSTLGVILMWNLSDQLFAPLRQRGNYLFGVFSSILVNIGAVSLTLPLGANIFGGFSTVSIPATLLTSLACEMLIVISNILCLFSLLPYTEFLCAALGQVCTKFSLYISDTAEWFASLKYSYVEAENVQIIFITSTVFLALLSLFISFGASKAVRFTLFAVVILSSVMSLLGVSNAIKQDNKLCVSYYRKNKDDRQLTAKLGKNGYLIFNSDDVICTNPEKSPFDMLSGKNHIVLIPNENTDPYVLSENIRNFSSRYGVSGVLVPNGKDGILLSEKLSELGIDCYIFPDSFEIDGIKVEFSFLSQDFYSLCVSDGKNEVFSVFADKYNKEYFDGHDDICAYFTRETKTQFKGDTDTPPECNLFITRAEKEFHAHGIFNTFGKTSFDLKE